MSESKKIKGSDLIAPDFLANSIDQAKEFLVLLKETQHVIIETNKVTSKKLKEAGKGSTSKDLKDANALMAESIKQRKLTLELEKAEAKAIVDLNKLKKQQADLDKKKLMEDEKAIKLIEQQNSAYGKASKRLNELRKEYKDLAISGKGADKATQDLLKTIQALDKELKEVDASVGQFNRSVGDYKNSVKEALEESDAFQQGLGKLDAQTAASVQGFAGVVGQLKKLREAQAAATTGAGKLANALKIGVIGLLLAAVAAISAFFATSREGGLEFDLILNKLKATLDVIVGSLAKVGRGLVGLGKAFKMWIDMDFIGAQIAASKAIDDMSSAFDGNLDAIEEQVKGYDKLTRAIFAFEDQLRVLQVVQAKFKMDEEDFNEIQNDNTISLNEQKAALEGAIQARLNAAKIATQISSKELELSKMQLELELRKNKVSEADIELAKKAGLENLTSSALSVKVNNDSLNAVQEKYLANLAAFDALDDLDRQESERKRKILQTETINGIELIRSKKLGADAAVQILTKQIADEKNQLEERESFQAQLSQKQKEALEEEIRLLGNFGLTQTEILDLINEKDAVQLANKLKALRATRLSEEAETELAKVILEAQNAQLARDAQQAKFDEERIKRQEKILRLEKETAIINENFVLDEISRMEEERQKVLDESNATILENENVFNKKLVSQRRDVYIQEKLIQEERLRLQQDLLEKQYDIDKTNIENTVDDEKIKIAELEKLDAIYAQNKAKLDADQKKQKDDSTAKELAQLQAIENRKTEIVIENLTKATDALVSELDKRQEEQSKKATEQIAKTQTEIQRQADLASRGLANTLAYQQEQLDKQQLAQEDAAKKAAKQKENLALVEALFNAYNAELKQPNSNPTTAAAKALADVLLLKGLSAGLVQFAAEGNDDIQGPGSTTSDSIPFMLSKHEGVVKASANMDNPGVVSALNSDTFDQLYMPKYNLQHDISGNTGKNIHESLILQTNKEIISLLQDIKSKPSQHVDVDKFGNLIETVYRDGAKVVTKHKNRRRIG
jgi:hypothetical protein